MDNTGCHIWLYHPQWIQGDMKNTKVEFDRVLFDRNGEWDMALRRWVCKEDGLYAIEFHLAMTMGTGGTNLQATLLKNGTELIAIGYGHQNDNACAYPKALVLLELKAGEYLEVYCRHDNIQDRQLVEGIMHCGLQIWKIG